MISQSVWFFFSKQKTAYEMRISDWSSDVCSSDLAEQQDAHGSADTRQLLASDPVDHAHPAERGLHFDEVIAVLARHADDCGIVAERMCAQRGQRCRRGLWRHHRHQLDRKSVVSGKSVSVRVELGGRRIIKKNKKNKNTIANLE